MTKQQFVNSLVLVCGIGLTGFGIFRVGVLPIDAPSPKGIRASLLVTLQSQGWRVRSTVAAKKRKDVSNAEGATLIKDSSAHDGTNNEELTQKGVRISLTPVRTRSAEQLGSDTIYRTINKGAIKAQKSLKIGNDHFMRFKDENQRQIASSCINNGKASSIKDQLKQRGGPQKRSWLNRMKRTIGIEPLTDSSCLFINISVDKGRNVVDNSDGDQAISRAWTQLKPLFKEPWESERVR